MINFEIPTSSIGRLSKAFNLMECHKLELGVVDYALSQSTLEQVPGAVPTFGMPAG